MDALFLLVGLSAFAPINDAKYGIAANKAKDALFVQTGMQADWNKAKGKIEKNIPQTLKTTAAVANAIRYKQVRLLSGKWAISLEQQKAKITFTIPF